MKRQGAIKKKMAHFFGVLSLAAVMLFYATSSFATIVGTAHDFSSSGGVLDHTSGQQICKMCHVPHNAGSVEVPLWRGTLQSHGVYGLYSSPTLNATVSQPSGPTKACLSCHDGTIAMHPVQGCSDCHGRDGPALVYLAQHHPVSFTYDRGLSIADGALRDPSTTAVPALGGRTIQQGMLNQNRMECSSCHDVHAAKGDSATAAKLLLVENTKSKLCLTCHNK